jgi:hypothetical protein
MFTLPAPTNNVQFKDSMQSISFPTLFSSLTHRRASFLRTPIARLAFWPSKWHRPACRKHAILSVLLPLYEQPFMSVDFGARAVKRGESNEFRERVRDGLIRAGDRNPLLHALLVPCGVTVL